MINHHRKWLKTFAPYIRTYDVFSSFVDNGRAKNREQ